MSGELTKARSFLSNRLRGSVRGASVKSRGDRRVRVRYVAVFVRTAPVREHITCMFLRLAVTAIVFTVFVSLDRVVTARRLVIPNAGHLPVAYDMGVVKALHVKSRCGEEGNHSPPWIQSSRSRPRQLREHLNSDVAQIARKKRAIARPYVYDRRIASRRSREICGSNARRVQITVDNYRQIKSVERNWARPSRM